MAASAGYDAGSALTATRAGPTMRAAVAVGPVMRTREDPSAP